MTRGIINVGVHETGILVHFHHRSSLGFLIVSGICPCTMLVSFSHLLSFGPCTEILHLPSTVVNRRHHFFSNFLVADFNVKIQI